MKYTTRMDVIQHNIGVLALRQRLAAPCMLATRAIHLHICFN